MKKISFLFCCILLVSLTSFTGKISDTKELYPTLNAYMKLREKDFNKIPEERKMQLKKTAGYIKTKLNAEKKANLVFICTHNSRRSHISQIMAYAAAEFYGIKYVSSFSGGTEATAFNERAVKALTSAGFVITRESEGANPVYNVKYAENSETIKAFSKKYADAPNPTSNFIAIMTCSDADKNCPFVKGASIRIALPYDDPKAADGKTNEADIYKERCEQIATEIMYVFSLVKSLK